METDRVADLLNDIRLVNPAAFEVVNHLRTLIQSVYPEVPEHVKYGGIMFGTGPLVCGIFSYTNHVSLEFTNGHALKDDHKVLEGGGKYRRHIKLRTVEDVTAKQVAEYLDLAFAEA